MSAAPTAGSRGHRRPDGRPTRRRPAGMRFWHKAGHQATPSGPRVTTPSRGTGRLLPAVSLFYSVADEDVLMLFFRADGVPGRFVRISKQEWTAALEDAARVGLLTSLGSGIYQIHPARVPRCRMAPRKPGRLPRGAEGVRALAVRRLRRVRPVADPAAALAYTILGLQHRTLGAMLGHALDHHAWNDADSIVRALDSTGTPAASAKKPPPGPTGSWPPPPAPAKTHRLQTPGATACGCTPPLNRSTRQYTAGQLDQAAQTCQQALAYLQDQPETKMDPGKYIRPLPPARHDRSRPRATGRGRRLVPAGHPDPRGTRVAPCRRATTTKSA
jgi:hypothetical protein